MRSRSQLEMDYVIAGVLAGMTLAGLIVVWASSEGVPVWQGMLTFLLAAVLVVEGAAVWARGLR